MEFGIEDLNRKIKNCTKCRLSETRINALCGEGNLDAKIMLVAQAPGENEDREGMMFIGPSGKVLDDLLELNNVKRDDLYMTNLVKCMLPKYRKPKQDEIDICSDYLDREIELIDPSVLVPLGHYATTYIFNKYGLSLPSKQDFYTVYGKLLLAGNRKILPLQHPAAILHDPDIRKVLVKNYHKLKILSKNCKWASSCPMKYYYEQGVLDKKWRELYCYGDWERCIRYQMEENGEPHLDWMLPDGTIDEKLLSKYTN
ncbi:MAG: uracil-DNA glycosylase [Candidatus Thermoplasmatota archaeon]|nr:uracil-DNA glycosylase [Candidatus Thermoplasmatota archaeon]